MNFFVFAAWAWCMVLVAACIYLYGQSRQAERCALPMRQQIAELAAETYRPMVRLLDVADLDVVRRAGSPGLLRRFRTQRALAFHRYLQLLRIDHARACRLLLYLALAPDADGPALLGLLVRKRLAFEFHSLTLRGQAALYRYGLATADARGVVADFEALLAELRRLPAARNPAAASAVLQPAVHA